VAEAALMIVENPTADLGLIAGSGDYPLLLARAARAAGVTRIVAAAFAGETDPALAPLVDEIGWLRVGQLGRMLAFFAERGIHRAIMAGQIAPKNLFDLRPDLKALLLLGKLRERNAASLFGAIADELAQAGVFLLPATTYLEHLLAGSGHLAGPAPGRRQLDDVAFAMRIARQVSALDIGQSVIVRHGTVLAVEAFEGTDSAIRRGGALAGKGGAVLAKVSKPGQDFRFDVPVIGTRTLEAAAEARLSVIAVEAAKTLLLEPERIAELARKHRICIVGG
jgi:DUF1009 family protein